MLKAATVSEVAERVMAWLAERGTDPAILASAREIWQAEGGPHAQSTALDRLVATIALVDPRAQAMLDLCSRHAAPK